ncbi:MAG: hypothetical protein LBS09_07710 [Bacteroidales bacterium]|nr:hypothetical protein [Bacteroidales bacterium]
MKKYYAVLFCIVGWALTASAQGEIDLQPKIFYRNEWSVAIMFNSNGFGGNYRYGKRVDAQNKRLWEVDFAYMKHPKENKSYSEISGAKYVYGKKNIAFDLRVASGRQREIFRKYDVGGIAVRYFYNYGAAVVLLKPIYYNVGEFNLVYTPVGNYYQWLPYEKPEKFDPEWYNRTVRIDKRASFFKGFNELQAVPGIFGKFGFNFEYSKQDKIIHALECGVILEAFAKKVEIMDFSSPLYTVGDVEKNRQLFLTLFVSYRFGHIIDPYEVKKKRERSEGISY